MIPPKSVNFFCALLQFELRVTMSWQCLKCSACAWPWVISYIRTETTCNLPPTYRSIKSGVAKPPRTPGYNLELIGRATRILNKRGTVIAGNQGYLGDAGYRRMEPRVYWQDRRDRPCVCLCRSQKKTPALRHIVNPYPANVENMVSS